MWTFSDDGDHFIHVVGLLRFCLCAYGACWSVLVEVELHHCIGEEADFDLDTVHFELVFAAIFVAG